MTLFQHPLRLRPWPQGNHPWGFCPVCRGGWRPYAGSLLNCHARCLFAPFDAHIIATDPRTNDAIAKHYQITIGVVLALRSPRRPPRRNYLSLVDELL